MTQKDLLGYNVKQATIAAQKSFVMHKMLS